MEIRSNSIKLDHGVFKIISSIVKKKTEMSWRPHKVTQFLTVLINIYFKPISKTNLLLKSFFTLMMFATKSQMNRINLISSLLIKIELLLKTSSLNFHKFYFSFWSTYDPRKIYLKLNAKICNGRRNNWVSFRNDFSLWSIIRNIMNIFRYYQRNILF